jgi:hypothetical protein
MSHAGAQLESLSESRPVSLLDPVPAPVQHLDAAALEWQPLLALVAHYAISRVGRESLTGLIPSTDQPWIEQQHQLVQELRLLLNAAVTIPLGGLFDPTQLAAKSQIPEAALEPAELQSIARLANDIAAWQALLRNPPAAVANAIQGLIDLSSSLTQNFSPLAESIQRKLLPDGALADDASPELSRIRHEQQRQQRVIEETLRAALRRLSSDNQTQDDLITIRGDRFVIPVKAEQKRQSLGRGPRRQLLRPNGLHRAPRNHRAKQRARPPARRRASRDSPHLRGSHASRRHLCGLARRRGARPRAGRFSPGPRALLDRLRLRPPNILT